ncbi:MAG: sigma 54-interacting transcriptional regulator [Desulfarculaceae bacterium]|nr:sigma 54-interacting transcriptional regulator [Desulfarculaceae bacterium]MCF8073017.1 sigma 54-interacting transcriptional regulator [Desulfarculaceae bacterium]MCF8101898.1 sigma 54-interacting transcriptional regulator [Desulfarculaceae bacterium]MCF8115425.1 sigma 54-interacting transcriptional regulator [Desulfarculaceae bacterium]
MTPPDQPKPPILEPGRVLEAVTLGVLAVDLEGRITYFNQAAERICGVGRKRALGAACSDVLKSTLCEEYCPVRRAMESGEEQAATEAVFIRQGGRSVVPVKVCASPLYGEQGEIVGAVETFQSLPLGSLQGKKDPGHRKWEDFIGASPEVGRMFDTLQVAAPSRITVLIEGPTGTGKDLLAQIVHHNSTRSGRPFIKVNCAALPENLLESELFGYSKGAFTGAERDKPGRFHLADGGTIFLDEISELPLSLQAKLLRVLEDREFFPLGAHATSKVDVRILAASNKPLAHQVEQGLFREDLYYRLNVIKVAVPSLKERSEDIPLLIRRFIQKKNVENGTYICRFSPETLNVLLNYDYPGNVREMENILEHACLLCRGDIIKLNHLPANLRTLGDIQLPPTSRRRQKDELVQVLDRHNWNQTQAAQELGINRTTLWRRMKRLGVARPQ